jgi:hypothetical protein
MPGILCFFLLVAVQAVCYQTAFCVDGVPPADGAAAVTAGDTGALCIPVRANDTTLFVDTLLAEDSTQEELEEDSSLLAEERSADSLAALQRLQDTTGMGITLAPKRERPGPAGAGLYPGLSPEQDSLARELIGKIWSFNWDGAEKTGRKMQKLERRELLPPLSSLLLSSACVLRIQNGEFSGKRQEKHCREELEKTAKLGLELSDPGKSPDSLLATNLMIYGGIKGILATLQINRNPINAAVEGLQALGILEKAVGKNPAMDDAYLGLGIFYCALAKASGVVRGALNLIGRPVSLEKGLYYLRQSAYNGRYTGAMAKLYLIQFLSPYQGDQTVEKSRIFKSLESSFPGNPFFVFLRLEENLCFHPEKAFDPSIRRPVRKKIASYDEDEDYSIGRYANLVRWQYRVIDPFAPPDLHPDTTFNLGQFAYYPAFLSALREKYAVPQSEIASPAVRNRRVALIRKIESRVLKQLAASSMNQSWRGFYAWHVRDALRMQ